MICKKYRLYKMIGDGIPDLTRDVNMVQSGTRETVEVSVPDMDMLNGANINQMTIMNEPVQDIYTAVGP